MCFLTLMFYCTCVRRTQTYNGNINYIFYEQTEEQTEQNDEV
jgi:hypothetical protein